MRKGREGRNGKFEWSAAFDFDFEHFAVGIEAGVFQAGGVGEVQDAAVLAEEFGMEISAICQVKVPALSAVGQLDAGDGRAPGPAWGIGDMQADFAGMGKVAGGGQEVFLEVGIPGDRCLAGNVLNKKNGGVRTG